MEKFMFRTSKESVPTELTADSMTEALVKMFGSKSSIPPEAEIKSYGTGKLWQNAQRMWPRKRSRQ